MDCTWVLASIIMFAKTMKFVIAKADKIMFSAGKGQLLVKW